MLALDDTQSLFYVAFELRCGIEARMLEYLQAWDHVARRQKEGWRIAELGKSIESALKAGDQIVRWAVHDRPSNELIICLYHTPVTQQLRKRGEMLGNYLHSLKEYRKPDDSWWDEFRVLLIGTASELQLATRGTLLGPPLMKGGTGTVEMKIDIPPGTDPKALHEQIFGRPVTVNVQYLTSLPDPIEDQAHLWSAS